MTKSEIKKLFSESIEPKSLCRVFMNYDPNYYYYYPIAATDKLFLGALEEDFILDGYDIRRFRDVKKLQIKNDMCIQIEKQEKLPESINCPEINLNDWHSVFLDLEKLNRNIIIEDESVPEDTQFVIGRIEKVCARYLFFRHFDADGNWVEDPYKIPYSEITTVRFATRYVDVFSKYLPPLPENFGSR